MVSRKRGSGGARGESLPASCEQGPACRVMQLAGFRVLSCGGFGLWMRAAADARILGGCK